MTTKISVDEVKDVATWVSVIVEHKDIRIIQVVNENTPDWFEGLAGIVTISTIEPFQMITLSP